MLQSAANCSHSWWWDSHVSPKHSRWLQENLTDMDLKVKAMLKLIEEDADSFAKRADMYYKKRPELISLVEEFYRAYRALAERYDHITGELHEVQYSMAEAFPNQLECRMDGDSPQISFVNRHNQSHQDKETKGFGVFMTEAGHQSLESRETTQSLSHSEEMEKEILNEKRGSHFPMYERTGSPSRETEASNEIKKLHKEILNLQQEKEILKKDCERGVQQYKVLEKQALQMQEELSHLQQENCKFNEDSFLRLAQINELKEQMCSLKKQNNDYAEDCKALRVEPQSEIQEQQELVTEMQNLDGTMHKSKKLTEVQYGLLTSERGTNGNKFTNLQDELSKLQHENRNLIMQVMTGIQCLHKADEEAQNLRQALSKSQAENDTMVFQYQQSLKLYEAAENRSKDLQARLSLAQEENRRIKDEMSAGVMRMKIVEEKAQNLEREKNAFHQEIWHRIKTANLLQEGILAKHNEEQNLSMRLQDETAQILRFDIALRNCQQSLSQSQEQQKRLTAELQEGNERLKDANERIKFLEEEIHHSQRENNKLMEKSSSVVMSMKNLEQEVYRLKQDKTNLLNEVAFRVDQRNALQQELYCLQEDRNDLDRRFNTFMKQIQSLGFDAESIHSSFVSLQNVSQKLREHCQIGEGENITLPRIAQKMEELINENMTLEEAVSSHQLEVERLQFEMKLLQQQVLGLQEEKVVVVVESEKHNEQVRGLEAKLQNVYNLYSQLDGENQQLKDKLTEALGQVKHLEEQVCNLQREKEALENEIAKCNLQVSYLKKQIHLLQEEGKDLKDKLQEETEKEQILHTEIEESQQSLCQMDRQNQMLLDDCQKHIGKYSTAEEKLMEMEKLTLMQQAENDMLQHNLSSEMQLNKQLEQEIEKVKNLFSIPNNVQGKSGSDDATGKKLVNSIVKEIESLQIQLSHFQQENKLLLDDVSVKNANLEQLKKDMSALCSQKKCIEEEAAIRFQCLVNLQEEISQLHEAAEALRIKLAVGVERERCLELEIKNQQQSLTNSLSARSLVEDEYQRTLEDYSSIKAHIKESQSMLSEMEQENQTLIIETLAQMNLVTMLESHIVEKDDKIQLLEEQLTCLQEKNAKLENELQNFATKAHVQEAEPQILQESICSSQGDKREPDPFDNEFKRIHEEHDQLNFHIKRGVEHVQEEDNHPGGLGQKLEAIQDKNQWLVKVYSREGYATDETAGKEFQRQISTLAEENIHVKLQVPVGCGTELEEPLNELHGESEITDDKITSPVKANKLQGEVMQGQQGKVLDEEAEGLHEALQSSKLEKELSKGGNQKHIDGCKNLETSMWVFQEKFLSKRKEKGKQGMEEAYKAVQSKELEVVVSDLEAEKQIKEAEPSSILMGTVKEDVCSSEEQNLQFLAHLEHQETDIQKLQDRWLKWFQDDIDKLQEMNRELSNQVQTQANEMLKVQPDIPMVHQILKELEEKKRSLKDECQCRIKELCDVWAKLEDIKNENTQLESDNRYLEAEQEDGKDKILQFCKDERMLEDEMQLQANEVKTLNANIELAKEVETQKMEMRSEELQIASVVSHGLKAKSEEVQDLQTQIVELQATVRDLQQENIQLKGIWQNGADDIIMEMREELPHMKGQDLSMMIVEEHSEYQEEKEVLVDEFKGRSNVESRVRQDIDLLWEETRKFWTSSDFATQQIQKLQSTVQDLQGKFGKLRQDKKQLKDDQWTRIKYNTIEKQFRELQGDLLLWIEHNNLLTKELQHRFASINRIQEEIAALKGGYLGNDDKKVDIAVNQIRNLQTEIFSIQEQSRKAADVLQNGSNQARGLEFEVERILLRFQEDMETSTADIHKKTYIQRVGIPLRAFFGKKERGQRWRASCACLQFPTHE